MALRARKHSGAVEKRALGRGHCVVFLGKTRLFSPGASLRSSGEKRGLLSQTAAGNRAYSPPSCHDKRVLANLTLWVNPAIDYNLGQIVLENAENMKS